MKRIFLAVALLSLALLPAVGQVPSATGDRGPLPPRQMEKLDRGVVAIHQGDGKVFVSWRLLGTDPDDIAFNVYRKSGDAEPVKLNREPLTKATCFVDDGVDFSKPVAYLVRPMLDGKERRRALRSRSPRTRRPDRTSRSR